MPRRAKRPVRNSAIPLPIAVSNSPLLNTAEAAGYIRFHPRFLEKDRCGAARVPYIKIANRVWYRRADLDAFIESCKRLSTSAQAAAAE